MPFSFPIAFFTPAGPPVTSLTAARSLTSTLSADLTVAPAAVGLTATRSLTSSLSANLTVDSPFRNLTALRELTSSLSADLTVSSSAVDLSASRDLTSTLSADLTVIPDSGAEVTPGFVRRWIASQGVTLDSGAVATWEDVNGNFARQATASQRPGIAGDGGIEFDGVNDFLVTDAASFAIGTVFIVFRWAGQQPDYNGLIAARTFPNANKAAESDENIGVTSTEFTTNLTGFSSTAINSVAVNGNAASIPNFENFLVGIDSQANEQIALLSFTRTPTNAGSKTFVIGADIFNSVGSRHSSLRIYEILMYSTQLSAGDIADTTNSLKSEYGIP